MKTFKQFLNEMAAVGSAPSYQTHYDKTALEMFKEHCSDAFWMLENDTPFWRGDSNVSKRFDLLTVDTSATSRKSENTSNWYTDIFDKLSNSVIPPRSKSFICSTEFETSRGFSYDPFALVPFDGTRIGRVNANDMWSLEVPMPRLGEFHPANINMFLSMVAKNKAPATIDTLLQIDADLKAGNPEAIRRLKAGLDKLGWSAPVPTLAQYDEILALYSGNFYKIILAAFAFENFGITGGTTATIKHWAKGELDEECWVSGKCLLLSLDTWSELVEYNREQK